MNRRFRCPAVLLLFACALALSAAAEEMPVFKLKPPVFNDDAATKARAVFRKTLGAEPVAITTATSVTFKNGRKVLQIDKRSGRRFMADMDRLWNPTIRPTLPTQARAQEIAHDFLFGNNLVPSDSARARVEFTDCSETMVVDEEGATPRMLDRQVNYRIELALDAGRFPVYGGGGKYNVTIGENGDVIGFVGGWRETGLIVEKPTILSKAEAETKFKRQFPDPNAVANVRSRLVYYAAPAFETQEYLTPVWVVSADVTIGNQTVQTREVVIAATSYGPFMDAAQTTYHPIAPSAPGDEPPSQQGWRKLPRQVLDLLGPTPAYAQTQAIDTSLANTFECGTSWMTAYGLTGSTGNKQGFIDQCALANWRVIFDHGDANALETDWRASDDSVVDNADLVFYTGHASPNGWLVSAPQDTFVSNTEVSIASSHDYWGNTDLEWLIIAACGPHQDKRFSPGVTTTAVSRWQSVFNGLHVFLAYGSVTLDNEREGSRFMELARNGWTVIDAWFRTADDIQPAGTYVTAMYAHNGDQCAGTNDHLWGMGYTCPDVPAGRTQKIGFIWRKT